MTHDHVKLGSQPNRLTEDLILLQNEKCIVKASTGTLTLPVLVDNEVRGHFFVGKGHFTLDAIVETPRGAVGKPVDKNLDAPFLMFGPIKNIQENSVPATPEEISSMGYSGLEDFLAKANDVLQRFIGNSHGHWHFERDSHLLAFGNADNRWDILISDENKLVYTSKDNVYISKDNSKSIAVQPESVVFKGNGKTVIISGSDVLVNRNDE
jgi:hypothetical protein